MSTNSPKLALIQIDVGQDRLKNLAVAKSLITKAARGGASFVCLPELFSYMGHFHPPCAAVETVNGPSISLLRELARKYHIYIVAGSILEKSGKRLPLNTCFMIGPKGEIISRYSKMHLFDINIPGRIKYCESDSMRPGMRVSIARTPFGVVGFAICNDLRYPEIFRKMVLAGARVIFVPAAFTKFTGRDHWLALTRVRAIENQCYIVAVNQSGRNADGVRFFGASVVVDPWGRVICEGPARGNSVLSQTIDLKLVDKIRKDLPALKKIHRTYPIRVY